MSDISPTVIIADDHPLFRVTLRLSVRSIAPLARIVEADSFSSLKSAVAANPEAGLVLLDLVMPGVEGLSSLQFLRGGFPGLGVAVLSSLSHRGLVDSVRAMGARAFIHKSVAPGKLQMGLRRLLAGELWWPPLAAASALPQMDDAPNAQRQGLSLREARILRYLDEGHLNGRIAADLDVGEATVEADIRALLLKLGLKGRG